MPYSPPDTPTITFWSTTSGAWVILDPAADVARVDLLQARPPLVPGIAAISRPINLSPCRGGPHTQSHKRNQTAGKTHRSHVIPLLPLCESDPTLKPDCHPGLCTALF